jgi:hypothetical protein
VGTPAEQGEFRRQIKGGKDLTAAFLLHNQLDGGDREDLGVVMAQRLDRSPTEFLEAAYFSCASIYQVKVVVVMLPFEVVDDRAGAMRVLRRRVELLQSVRVERYREHRDAALEALNHALRIVERSGQ